MPKFANLRKEVRRLELERYTYAYRLALWYVRGGDPDIAAGIMAYENKLPRHRRTAAESKQECKELMEGFRRHKLRALEEYDAAEANKLIGDNSRSQIGEIPPQN